MKMKNQIVSRKTSKGTAERTVIDFETSLSVTETYIVTRFADTFEIPGDVDSATVYKEIPVLQCYVKSGRQKVSDLAMNPNDVRSWSVDIHAARQRNADKGLGWKTNWELKQAEKQAEEHAKYVSTHSLEIFFS